MNIPAGLLLMANVLDVVTCGTLHYSTPQHGVDSRTLSAVDILNNDWVHNTEAFGVYKVRSRTLQKDGSPIWYSVLCDGEDLHCQCMDDAYRGNNHQERVICAHLLAGVMYHAMKITFRSE